MVQKLVGENQGPSEYGWKRGHWKPKEENKGTRHEVNKDSSNHFHKLIESVKNSEKKGRSAFESEYRL